MLEMVLCATPLVVGAVLPDCRHLAVCLLEAVAITAASCSLVGGYLRGRPVGKAPGWRTVAWLAHCFCLGVATLEYNLSVGQERYPRNFIGDIGFSLAVGSLLALSCERYARALRPRDYLMLLFAFLGALQLHYRFLFVPFAVMQERPPPAAVINFYLYSGISAGLVATMMLVSMRTMEPAGIVYAHCVLLWSAADFSARFHAISTDCVSVNWAESVYAAGLGGMFFIVCRSRRLFVSDEAGAGSLAPWHSVRALLGIAVFSGNVLLLAGVTGLKIYRLEDAFDLTLVLIVLIGAWFGASITGAYVSKRLEGVVALLPSPRIAFERAAPEAAVEAPRIVCRIGVAEFDQLIAGYNVIADEMSALSRSLIEQTRVAALGQVATQVAHDIRSPLAALSMFERYSQRPSEELRAVMRGAIRRIEDIAQDLLNRRAWAADVCQKKAVHREPTCLLVPGLIDKLVAEKRVQSRARCNVVIETQADGSVYGLFVRALASDICRALSSLLDNAIESLSGQGGLVQVKIGSSRQWAWVSIADDGRGIAPHVLARLGQQGATHGKFGGRGLGVHGVLAFAHRCGGRLRFESEEGAGTQVHLQIPRAEPPAWFLTELDLRGCHTVVVYDEDVTIRRIWFERIGKLSPTIRILHASTHADLSRLAAATGARTSTCYLLGDELAGEAMDGIEAARDLGIAARSVLVTSRFEQERVIEACVALGMSVVPKPVASMLPILLPPADRACRKAGSGTSKVSRARRGPHR